MSRFMSNKTPAFSTGLLNSFGTFQVYYKQNYLSDISEGTISWIGSIQLFLLFIGGMVFGPIFDKKGSKVLFWPGTFIYVLSLMFTSVCTKYYQFILAQGILYGVADAMLFYPTISTMSHWFNRRRGLAMGIVVAGSSIGGIAWPLILNRLFQTVGFGWALRIVGFICLALLVPSCFLVVPRVPPQKQDTISGPEVAAMFKDVPFMAFVFGMFFVMWGMFIPMYYLPFYGLEHGMSGTMSNNLIAILNAGSLVGRVISGVLADKYGRFNMAIACSVCSGIVLLCLHVLTTHPQIIAFSVLYGFFSGGLISLQSACIAQITPKIQMTGIRIGMMMSISSFGVLTGSPIGGALMSVDGGAFYGLIDFSGVILLTGAALVIFARLAIDKNIFKSI